MLRPSNVLVVLLALVFVAACSGTLAPGNSPTPVAKIVGGTVTIRMQGDWGKAIDGGQTVTTANGGMLSSSITSRTPRNTWRRATGM